MGIRAAVGRCCPRPWVSGRAEIPAVRGRRGTREHLVTLRFRLLSPAAAKPSAEEVG